MRLWSLHPRLLDAKGLVTLWREALLAQAVLAGRTRGYRHHPQLHRFLEHPAPQAAIASYLMVVYHEAWRRGYHFDKARIEPFRTRKKLLVTKGQLEFEFAHLCAKLACRDVQKLKELKALSDLPAHPLFRVKEGDVESWEKGMPKRML